MSGPKNTFRSEFYATRREGEQVILGPKLSYAGHRDCTSLMCRRMGLVGPCIGWHCAVCDQPSSMYGHAECQARQDAPGA